MDVPGEKMEKRFLAIIPIVLLLSYAFYSLHLYTATPPAIDQGVNDHQVFRGKMVWQKYNCQSCHQLYGLGGYLGPDLTNVVSSPGKDKTYITAMLSSGTGAMPVFSLSQSELDDLLAFFDATDRTGISDPRAFEADLFGNISPRHDE